MLKLDSDERLVSFDFAKITCGQPIDHETGFARHCRSKTLPEILAMDFIPLTRDLNILNDEVQFVLYLEWDALRCAIAQYLGKDIPEIDKNRCQISEISHSEEGIEIAQVILPPAEMPKIIACGLKNKTPNT
jgi:hypothetical protein